MDSVCTTPAPDGSDAADNFKIPTSAPSQCSIISNAEIEDNIVCGDSSDVNANHVPIVDWSTIEIETVEDGNMDALISQEKMCLVLGINENSILHPPAPIVECVIDKELLAEAAIAVDDRMPEELNISYDIDNPTIEVGTVFSSMHDCRMAIRQFAIKEEFDLGVKKADRTRWSGECLADNCPWTITARVMADKKTTRITQIKGPHRCYSSSQVTSSMASQSWVKQRAIPILRKEPNIGAKALRTKLQDTYNVKMEYHTVWKGREKALDEVFGTWGNSFQFLFNFKAEMEKRDPGSVVEVDTIVDDADGETEDNWTWFMEQVRKAIGPLPLQWLGSQNRCKKCGVLGHRQNTCPTNGTRKRKRKSRKSSAGGALTIDEAAARAACVELPISESSMAAQCTPVKNSVVATLQASPGPVTRRQLSLAMAEDAALELVVSPPRDVQKTAPKKITPRKKKKN